MIAPTHAERILLALGISEPKEIQRVVWGEYFEGRFTSVNRFTRVAKLLE